MTFPSRRAFLGASAALAVRSSAAGADHPAVARAMQAVLDAASRAERDPERPAYHFRPPAQWNNDPNGTIFHRGWHHLFYQQNPYDARWEHMHWGHARSRDLVNWEHLPIALWPSQEKGEDHVFSGAAIDMPDGRPLVFYTSIGKRAPEQWLAAPQDDDLLVWQKHPANPILRLDKSNGGLAVQEWRDPFLFRERGRVYMVCGGNLSAGGGRGSVLLYEAANRELTDWKFRGVVYEYRERSVFNIECPNLFRLGPKWVLLISPHRPCEYFIGDLDLERARFTPETHGVLDPGTAYASNISRDDLGRTLLWLWGRTETDPAQGWNGCMTLPRVLSIGPDGYLRQNPPAEFKTLRGEPRQVVGIALAEQPAALDSSIAGDCLELEASLAADEAHAAGLRLRCGQGRAGAEITWQPGDGVLTVGGAKAYVDRGKQIRLRVFLDKRVLEVYANDGAAAVFVPVRAGAADRGIEAFAKGGSARLESLSFWPMRAARFSMEHYRVAPR